MKPQQPPKPIPAPAPVPPVPLDLDTVEPTPAWVAECRVVLADLCRRQVETGDKDARRDLWWSAVTLYRVLCMVECPDLPVPDLEVTDRGRSVMAHWMSADGREVVARATDRLVRVAVDQVVPTKFERPRFPEDTNAVQALRTALDWAFPGRSHGMMVGEMRQYLKWYNPHSRPDASFFADGRR